jgi:hypothetical protein
MTQRLIPVLAFAFFLSAIAPSFAHAGVASRRSQRTQECKRAIAAVVDRTYFGNPAIRFTGSRRTQAIDLAYSAIQARLTPAQVESQTYSRLWMVRNTYFRRDIAQAAAAIASQSRGLNACKK